MSQLEKLNAGFNCISDLDEDMDKPMQLVSSLSPLPLLPKLSHLSLEHNHISDLDHVNLKKLEDNFLLLSKSN